MPYHQFFASGSRRSTRPIVSTWPSTKWPPNSFPAVSGCSKFTRFPVSLAERSLRKVSPERSAEKYSWSTSTTVRQQPLTAMLFETSRRSPHLRVNFQTPPSALAFSESRVPTAVR